MELLQLVPCMELLIELLQLVPCMELLLELLQLDPCLQLELVDVDDDLDVSQELPVEEESPELPVLFLDLVSKRPLTPRPPP